MNSELEQINVVFQFNEEGFTGYKFSSLRSFVQQLSFRAFMSPKGNLQDIPGIHLVSAASNLLTGIRVACQKFGVTLIEDSSPQAEYVGIINHITHDQVFENLYSEILDEVSIKENLGT